MLPRRAFLLYSLYKNPKTCFRLNTGKYLVGVLNIKNKKMTLFPCIQEKVWLEANPKTGEFIRGWLEERKDVGIPVKGKELPDDLSQYNKLPFAPRVLTFSGSEKRISSHEYLIKLMDEEKNKSNYRGFSVIPGASPIYTWDSTSLNSQTGLTLFKKMPLNYQNEVEAIIKDWHLSLDNPKHERGIKYATS